MDVENRHFNKSYSKLISTTLARVVRKLNGKIRRFYRYVF